MPDGWHCLSSLGPHKLEETVKEEYSTTTQFIDLAAQQRLIRTQIDVAIERVLDHGHYIMGPEVKDFEGQLRKFTGAKHALTCANGTDALTLVLILGVGSNDAVFVPSFTYVASAEAQHSLALLLFLWTFSQIHTQSRELQASDC